MKALFACSVLVLSLAVGSTTATAAPATTVAYRQNVAGIGTVVYVFSGNQAAYFGRVFNGGLGGRRVYTYRGSLIAAWYHPGVGLRLTMYATPRSLGELMLQSISGSARKAGFVRLR